MAYREFLTQFLHIYESEPCLWKVRSKEYHDKKKRHAAYGRLVSKLREPEPKATEDDVKKKINNLRSAYRKEKKKIKQSIRSGATGEDIYKPRLWYYPLLSFLDDHVTPRKSHSNEHSDDDDDDDYEDNDDVYDADDIANEAEVDDGICQQTYENSSGFIQGTLGSTPTPLTQGNKRLARTEEMEYFTPVKENFKRPSVEEDRFDIVAKGFAVKLRGLPKQQMLLAEKLMNDVLFEAEMGTLTLSHHLVSAEPILQ